LGREEALEAEVLRKIKPKPEEYVKVRNVYEKIRELLEAALEREGIDAEIELEGSVAKDTWISGDVDLDVFVLYPKDLGREWLKTHGFRIILEATKGLPQTIAYAEHPYVKVTMDSIDVDVVPAFKLKDPLEAETVVDRTPFHTRYVISKLSGKQKDEVRLLKKFMKTIGVYGAEIKVSGFSGYLVELLVIYYGSFKRVLEAASETWKPGLVIDVERYFRKKDLSKITKKFQNQPLIVIDPVDYRRNVAAAVSPRSMATFIAASKTYLRNPSELFFFKVKVEPTLAEVMELISSKPYDYVFVLFPIPKKPPDILWGFLRRSVKGIKSLLEKFGFNVLDYDVWCDEREYGVFVFELESEKISDFVKSEGPLIFSEPNSSRFLSKYVDSELTIAGPWIEDFKWVVIRKRKFSRASNLLKERLLEHGVSRILQEHLRKTWFKVLLKEDLKYIVETVGDDFLSYLRSFVRKKPEWLRI